MKFHSSTSNTLFQLIHKELFTFLTETHVSIQLHDQNVLIFKYLNLCNKRERCEVSCLRRKLSKRRKVSSHVIME